MTQAWHYQAAAGDHDYLVYDEATGRDVAIVRDFNEQHARLIAAAPELLAALRVLAEIAGHVGPTTSEHDLGNLAVAYGQALSVIAKATQL